MVEVRLITTGPRFGKAHVTDAAGHFREILSGVFRVGLPRHAMIRQELIDLGCVRELASDEVGGRLADNSDVLGGSGLRHVSPVRERGVIISSFQISRRPRRKQGAALCSFQDTSGTLYGGEQAPVANEPLHGFKVTVQRAVAAKRADVLANMQIGGFRALAGGERPMEFQTLCST